MRDQPGPASAMLEIGRFAEDAALVAMRGGQGVTWRQFGQDAAALAALLPGAPAMLNLCANRYRFMVGLAAAAMRRQMSVLPPSDAPGVLDAVATGTPGLYALTDGLAAPVDILAYPEALAPGAVASAELWVAPEQPAITLFTSGSTGLPKPMAKPWGPLLHSARAAGERLGIADLAGGTIIGTVPHQHSYGFESIVLLALQHGLAVDTGCYLFPADIRGAIARAAGPRILVTTPTHIRAILAEPDEIPRLDLILSATAPLSPALATEAEARSGGRLIEIYGCTEAGQVATRRTAKTDEWTCLDGVVLTPSPEGTIASGPSVAEPTRLHDLIEMTGERTFRLGGRSADLVDVAGKRTSLAHLNHVLLGVEGVTDGAFVMSDASRPGVARLAALAVAPGVTADAILRALRQRIDPAFLPRPLTLLDALPRNALGKLPRETLLRLATGG